MSSRLAVVLAVSCLSACLVTRDADRGSDDEQTDDAGETTPDAGSPDGGLPDRDAGLTDTEADLTACTNGVDDDGDGYTDCVDFECRGLGPCAAGESTADTCADGLDNDGNGYTDCIDFACRGKGPCGPESTVEACTDGFDNDADGYKDCVDFECRGIAPCGTESTAEACSDGRDNDGDGYLDCIDHDCAEFCNVDAVRIATWNVQTLGAIDSTEFAAALTIVQRMNADILCFNEINDYEAARLQRFATLAGYPHLFQGRASTPMAGGLTNACLSRFPFADARSRTSHDISSDTTANETGRDLVHVRVEVRQGRSFVALVSVHLKSGFTDADEVRKYVEAIRARDIVRQHRVAHPDDAIVVLGDFNEEVGGSALGHVHTGPPEGLPLSWRLGSDLTWPMTYNPFAPLIAEGLADARATHEDKPAEFATRIPSGRRIDYTFTVGARVREALVYEACQDDGVDGAPAGDFMAFAGTPVTCGTNIVAADHRPVLVELELP